MTTITNTSVTTSDLNATRTATDQELIADFQGANGKNQFTRYGHHNAQNTGHSTTNYWSWATRTNGNYDLAYGTLNATNTNSSANNIINITTDGHIIKPKTPHVLAMGFHSHVSGTHFGTFQTITTNTGTHYNNSTGRFTCPVDGRYFVSAFSGYKQATNHAGIGIAYNGSVLAYGWSEGDDRHATQGTTLVYDANANDYFNYFCHSSYTSPILPTGSDHHSFFSVYLLG